MGKGDSPKCEDGNGMPTKLPSPVVGPQSFYDVSLVDAPILLLFYFHNAIRQELCNLHSLAVTALESVSDSERRDLMIELRRRFQFLQLAQEYHCAVEDEVIFVALDVHIKNVAHAYSLEHNSIDNFFNYVFDSLDSLTEGNKDDPEPFEELVSGIATMQSSLCHHMLKEEEQVFPLLLQQFSPREQASLAWQFFYVIPVTLLKELLPWMISFLCLEKQVDVIRCIKEIVPPEKSLQEVVNSWLHRNDQSSLGTFTNIRKEVPDKSACMRRAAQLHFSKSPLEKRKKKNCVQTCVGGNGIEYLYILHRIIRKDLKEIHEEALHRTCSSCLNIDSVVLQLKFLSDIIIFYSHALKKFVYPELKENDHLSTFPDEQFLIETPIKHLHQLLQHDAQNDLPLAKFAEKICQELESFVMDISKWFYFQETEVFPLISKNCSSDTQQQLLHMSLHLIPLGLLKCAMPWLAAHLSENEASSLLHSINQGDFVANKSFQSLLLEWFSSGYSPKTSNGYFGKNLRTIFNKQCSYLPEKITSRHTCTESRPSKIEMISANKGKMILSYAPPGPPKNESFGTSYASEVNLHLFFPGTKRSVQHFPKFPGGESSMTSVLDEPKPADIIFFVHKALRKDLDYLVSGSAKLAGNTGFLKEFSRRFNLLRLRYHFHSATEDEIAFPSLEMNGEMQNISVSYSIDHKLEAEYFNRISLILEKLSDILVSNVNLSIQDHRLVKYNKLCMKLHQTCKSMHKLLSDHIHHEEIELWPLFRKISIKEQEKIIGQMLGGARAETIQDLIPWLIDSLTHTEQDAVMSSLRQVTKNTMFNEWLAEWLEGHGTDYVSEESKASLTSDPLEIILKYLPKDASGKQGDILCEKGIEISKKDCASANIDTGGNCNLDSNTKLCNGDQENEHPECEKLVSKGEIKRCNEETDVRVDIEKPDQPFQSNVESGIHEQLLTMSQDDLQAAIRKASCDPSLDPQKKSYIMQYLLMSRWIVQGRISKATISSDGEKIPGQYLTYFDARRVTLGCKHYKRNCKLVTPCCNKIYTCIRCHDEEADHATDRRAITQMMCMKCLVIQPIGKTCITAPCKNLSMGRYYCRICKLFDDDREIYHCPYCNLCRLGRGLGIDYFHCMNCNACMSRSLRVHTCREKCLEENCPICHEYIFTSSAPVKSLPCGHLMHSACFQDYTCTHYICPICSKSLGDMQVYFKMLDTLLAEVKMPDEYCGKTQAILCNDCEKRGAAAFHWHYHKCPYCGSYNTRLL
ncbi:zinc finger protein BRUTUS-like At1g74770 [Euphorbia lathyris]|uniref:zinc finger protein BRUTUS-like At1g74770 n=1 Tax=Euphorbia lathyris TaxID=212925 RepID=UPI0033140218